MKKINSEKLNLVANIVTDSKRELCIIDPDSLPQNTISVIEENYKYSFYRAMRTHHIRGGGRLGGIRQSWMYRQGDFLSFYRSVLDIMCDLPFYMDQKEYYPIRQSSFIGYTDCYPDTIFLLLGIVEPQDEFPHVLMLKGIGYSEFEDKLPGINPFGYGFPGLRLVDRNWICRASRIQTMMWSLHNVHVIELGDKERKENAKAERKNPGRNAVVQYIKRSGKFEQVYLYSSDYYELAYFNYRYVNNPNKTIVDYIMKTMKPMTRWRKMYSEIQSLTITNCYKDKKKFKVIGTRAVAEIVRKILKDALPDFVRCVVRHGAFKENIDIMEAYYLELSIIGSPNTQFGFYPYGIIKGIPTARCFSEPEKRFLLLYGYTHNQRLEQDYSKSSYAEYKSNVERIIYRHLGIKRKELVCEKTDNPNEKRNCDNTVHQGAEPIS